MLTHHKLGTQGPKYYVPLNIFQGLGGVDYYFFFSQQATKKRQKGES